jgi:uncharacterized protein (TIGR01777 family)
MESDLTTMAKCILIGGGSGLVGQALAEMLSKRGDEVRILSRRPGSVAAYQAFAWDVNAQTIDAAAFAGVTHVVNLAGAGIADERWSPRRKELIISSRTRSTDLLAKGIEQHGKNVQAYVSASAIGYYGNSGDAWMKEDSESGDGFLSQSTRAWEAAVDELAEKTGLRTCYLRTGIALSPDGGALERMLQPARWGISGYFGSGQQWYSWIHLDDLARIYVAAIDDERYKGAINATAPVPVRNRQLARELADALDNPALALPVPAVMLKFVFGEMSHTILDSCRVSSQLIVDKYGFDFQFPDVRSALRDLLA